MNRPSKLLSRALGVLVFVIWGVVGYQVYEWVYDTAESLEPKESPLSAESNRDYLPYTYRDDVRDPFLFRSLRKSSTQSKAIAWTPPPLKLNGILTQRKRRSVVLERSDGSVFFLHEGDTLSGVKIIKITDEGVSYVYNSRKDTWALGKTR